MLSALRTSVHAMCVGPVTARPLVRLGVPTSAPERMRLGALARHITDELPLLCSRTIRVAGHLLEIRGTCVLVDGAVKAVSPAGMATIRALAHHPGAVVSAQCPARRTARQRHRHARRRDGRAAATNCAGRQEHRVDGGQARLPPGRRRGIGARTMSHAAGGARHPQADRRGDGRRPRRTGSAALGARFMWRSSTCSARRPAKFCATSTSPAVVVPAFLSRGYHVNADIPAHVAASGHPRCHGHRALGPSPQLARVLADRLIECGWRPDDSVILAAAGTSDPRPSATCT